MASKPKAAPAAMNDPVPLKGKLKIELVGPDGKVKDARNVDNLVTTVGKNALADQILAAPSFTKPTHMAVGTGAVAPALGDTALGTESARVAFTTKTRAANVVTYVGDYAAGVGTAALTEAGIFDAAAAGNMWQRVTFAVVTKGASDTDPTRDATIAAADQVTLAEGTSDGVSLQASDTVSLADSATTELGGPPANLTLDLAAAGGGGAGGEGWAPRRRTIYADQPVAYKLELADHVLLRDRLEDIVHLEIDKELAELLTLALV